MPLYLNKLICLVSFRDSDLEGQIEGTFEIQSDGFLMSNYIS